MASAIHKTGSADSLQDVAAQYYFLAQPTGGVDDVRQKKVVEAIRRATPSSVIDLTTYDDEDALPSGTTLYVPTLRDLNRIVYPDSGTLADDLLTEGFGHARKLLVHEGSDIAAVLPNLGTSYTSGDVERTWVISAFLNLDGMDRYTAVHLYDVEGITSLSELAAQSEASITTIIQTLITSYGRPSALSTQEHEKRWPLEAKIITRQRLGGLAKTQYRILQTPFHHSQSQQLEEFYEAKAADDTVSSDDAKLASFLALLYRFQTGVLRGNRAVQADDWAEAASAYQEAKCAFHRLAEETGAVSSTVDDEDGLNFDTCSASVKALLDLLPSEDENPLGAPSVELRRGQRSTSYRLRSFLHQELNTQAKYDFEQALSSVTIQKLPQRIRSASYRGVLGKQRSELGNASGSLIQGLVAGPDLSLARDFESQDGGTLRRNLGSVGVGTSGLDLFTEMSDKVPCGDLVGLVGVLWSGPTDDADHILGDEAKLKYPDGFLTGLSPFARFVHLPGASSSADDTFLVADGFFVSNLRDNVVKPRLRSNDPEDLIFDEACWASPGAFAAIAPYVYALQVPIGLGRAYLGLDQPLLASKHGGLRVNTYDSDGDVLFDVAGMDTSAPLTCDLQRLSCTTHWGEPSALYGQAINAYASWYTKIADNCYRSDDREGARSRYRDVMCAIQLYWSQAEKDYADQIRVGFTGLYEAIGKINDGSALADARDPNSLSLFNVQYQEGGTTKKVLEDMISVIRKTTDVPTTAERAATIEQWFQWYAPTGKTDITTYQPVAVASTQDIAGSPIGKGVLQYFVAHAEDAAELVSCYTYCMAQVVAIDQGINWYGFNDEFVPPWSFEHLYNEARNMCNRALEAEQRVFSLLQLWEAAEEKEFLASQAEEMANKQASIADLQVTAQIASNRAANKQAKLAEQQAEAQSHKSATQSWILGIGAAVVGIAAGIATAGGFTVAAVATGVSGGGGLAVSCINSITGHSEDKKVLDRAKTATAATRDAGKAALAVAIAQAEAAYLGADQASAYIGFLASQTLNSEGYAFLLSLVRQVAETYQYHSVRLAWLAQRAVIHESRRMFDVVGLSYRTGDELTDLTCAQRLTADLEVLRSEYVAGQTERLQEIKWTVALSVLSPVAWEDLRSTGECTFVLRQQMVDRLFPGLYQHRLKEITLEIVGLVPPEGARGILRTTGVSWARVPNEGAWPEEELEADWVTEALDGTGNEYDGYIMKPTIAGPVEVSLSQFDARVDRAVLSSPQGMLKPLEHQGLDAGWTLKLHRQSNDFDFENIVDVEFTFWFLAAYDADLEAAQVAAWTQLGEDGELKGASITAYVVREPEAWSQFVGEPTDSEALDLRLLFKYVLDADLGRAETERKLENIMLVLARAEEQTGELTLRLACDADPVGVKLTTSDGAAFTLLNVDTSEEDPALLPAPNATLESWLQDVFWSGSPSAPTTGPEGRWVIKVEPAQAGADWYLKDEDGNDVTTTSGALSCATNPGTLTFDDGTTWTDMAFSAKVMHQGSTVRMRVRDDGTYHYALEISPTQVRLIYYNGTSDVVIGTRSLEYPSDEFLHVKVAVVSQDLSVTIDGLTVWDKEAGGGSHTTGSVALEATSIGGSNPEFDDVKVVRLTKLWAEAETLLEEPFTGTLPDDWTTGGSGTWSISASGHRILDLSTLRNLVLELQYQYELCV